MSKLRIGFVGAGRMGEFHAKKLSELSNRAVLTAVADIKVERARQLADEYGAKAYDDFYELLSREHLDGLFILSPPSVRIDPIQLACEREIAIFCEKPPALKLNEAQRITEIIERADVINSVGFMYRWYQSVEKAREILADQKITCLQSLFLCGVALDPAQPKWTFIQEIAGGPLLEQAIHSIDVIRYLAGEVQSIIAFGGNPVLPKSESFTIEDSHALSMRFESHAVGCHLHSWTNRKAIVKVQMFGTDIDLTLNLIPPGSLKGRLNGEDVAYTPANDDPYLTQIGGFLDAITKRDQSILRSTYKDATRSLKITLEAMESAFTRD
jgi:predicted dehydrogenase